MKRIKAFLAVLGTIVIGILIIWGLITVKGIVFNGAAVKSSDSEGVLPQRGFSPVATEKTTFNKVNEIDGISLKTSDKAYSSKTQEITVVFENKTDKEYIFGEPYSLEKFESGQWYKLSEEPSDIPRAWNDIGYILKPNSTVEKKANLEWIYGNNFKTGKYRIVKDIIYSRAPGDYDTFYFAAEFEILNNGL